MTENNYTPGPWVVKGRTVEAPSRLDLGVAQAIAGMTAGSRGASQITVSEAEANARLIAAAPDMLEALIAVHNCGNAGAKLSRVASDKARAAIKKAQGRA